MKKLIVILVGILLVGCGQNSSESVEPNYVSDDVIHTSQGTINIIHREGYDIVLLNNNTSSGGDDMEVIAVDIDNAPSTPYYEHSCGEEAPSVNP